jgi:hypothetical protein
METSSNFLEEIMVLLKMLVSQKKKSLLYWDKIIDPNAQFIPQWTILYDTQFLKDMGCYLFIYVSLET